MKKFAIAVLFLSVFCLFIACHTKESSDKKTTASASSTVSQQTGDLGDENTSVRSSAADASQISGKPLEQGTDNTIRDVWDNTTGSAATTSTAVSRPLASAPSAATSGSASSKPAGNQATSSIFVSSHAVISTNSAYETDSGWLPWK